MSERIATFIKELLLTLLLKACMEALGMEDGRIPDSAINASSFVGEGAHPRLVRLNSPSAWVAAHNDPKSWLQVDLGKDAMIKKIATQGKSGAHHWVKTYTLSSRANGETDWVTYTENEDVKVSPLFGIWFI